MTRTWREDLAWCAGLFDGEGNVGKVASGFGYRLNVSNTDLDMLEEFKSIVKCGYIGKNPGGPVSKLQCYRWYTTNWADAQAVMAMLWIFLSSDKKRQAQFYQKEYLNKYWAKRKLYTHGGLYYAVHKRCPCALCRQVVSVQNKKNYGGTR